MLIRSRPADDQPLTEDILSYLQREGIVARVKGVGLTSASAAVRALQEEGASQLVLSRNNSLLADQHADVLLSELNLPITVTP